VVGPAACHGCPPNLACFLAMEPGAGPLRGVFAAVDVHYLAPGGAWAPVVVSGDATFSAVVAENTVVVPEMMAY
jgi:hypothetical protein